MTPERRIAVVHERFTEFGGSETVAAQLASIAAEIGSTRLLAPIADVPELDVATAGGTALRLPIEQRGVRHLRRTGGGYAHLLPLLPSAFAAYDLRGTDLVLASHHAFANRVRFPDGTHSISYVHTPARWLWDPAKRRDEAGTATAKALGAFAVLQRNADRAAAERFDLLLANSTAVAERIRRWWGLPSRVVYPPVNTDFYRPDPTARREDFVLYAGRVVPYKRADLVAAAAKAGGLPLVVAGEGRALERCRELAGPRTRFLGRVDDATLRDLYRRCRMLVLAGEEDFGIVPVEAAACGAPIVGLNAGGTRDTVIDGVTGRLVNTDPNDPCAVHAFAAAMREMWDDAPSQRAARAHAERFSITAFRAKIHDAIADVMGVPAAASSGVG